jgi:hypothetical protein
MIDIASQAKQGAKIPGQKAIQGQIITLFKDHLIQLKAKLNVSPFLCPGSLLIISQSLTVQGEVSLTCDAWQASNTNVYFAVMAHWIEELTPAKWELKSVLIGFTLLNNAHNSVQLGQALFKITKRMGIEHKVSVLHLMVCVTYHFP